MSHCGAPRARSHGRVSPPPDCRGRDLATGRRCVSAYSGGMRREHHGATEAKTRAGPRTRGRPTAEPADSRAFRHDRPSDAGHVERSATSGSSQPRSPAACRLMASAWAMNGDQLRSPAARSSTSERNGARSGCLPRSIASRPAARPAGPAERLSVSTPRARDERAPGHPTAQQRSPDTAAARTLAGAWRATSRPARAAPRGSGHRSRRSSGGSGAPGSGGWCPAPPLGVDRCATARAGTASRSLPSRRRRQPGLRAPTWAPTATANASGANRAAPEDSPLRWRSAQNASRRAARACRGSGASALTRGVPSRALRQWPAGTAAAAP